MEPRRPGGADHDRLVGYAIAIASNYLLDRQRGAVAIPIQEDSLASGPEESPEAEVGVQEQLGALLAKVRNLPPREREVVLLVLRRGLTTGEVAQMLDIKRESVRRYLARAIIRLRDNLES